jgi:hypothetical protein
VSHRAPIQTILTGTSQLMRGDGLLRVLGPVERTPDVSPLHRSSFFSSLASWQADYDAASLTVRFTHALLLQPVLVGSSYKVWSGVIASASSTGALQTDVSIERQFSRIFPAHPRSLARCLSRALRHGTALLFRLSENLFSKSPHRTRTKKILRTFRKCAVWPWERGTLASLRARVSRGQSGQIHQGEMTWHSTKTNRN